MGARLLALLFSPSQAEYRYDGPNDCGDQSLHAGASTALFPIVYSGLTSQYPYDVSADGQRFLVIEPVDDRQMTPVTILLDWHPPQTGN
jgi:hypothetical protein